MENRIYNLLLHAQAGDKGALSEVLIIFSPSLKFSARLLNYEDAYNDLIVELIEVINKLKLDTLRANNDAALISYFNIVIRNLRSLLIKNLVRTPSIVLESSLTSEQLFMLSSRSSVQDSYDNLVWEDMRNILTAKEFIVLFLIFHEGRSVIKISQVLGISRQAVNKLKLSAFDKLKSAWKEQKGLEYLYNK